MSTFDLKKFLINEGMTRVSRDRKRLLKEEWDKPDKPYRVSEDPQAFKLASSIISGKNHNGYVIAYHVGDGTWTYPDLDVTDPLFDRFDDFLRDDSRLLGDSIVLVPEGDDLSKAQILFTGDTVRDDEADKAWDRTWDRLDDTV